MCELVVLLFRSRTSFSQILPQVNLYETKPGKCQPKICLYMWKPKVRIKIVTYCVAVAAGETAVIYNLPRAVSVQSTAQILTFKAPSSVAGLISSYAPSLSLLNAPAFPALLPIILP